MRLETGVTTKPSVNHYQSKTALSWRLPTAALCLEVFLTHSLPGKHLCFVVDLCLYIVFKILVNFLEETLESFKLILNFYVIFTQGQAFVPQVTSSSHFLFRIQGKLMEGQGRDKIFQELYFNTAKQSCKEANDQIRMIFFFRGVLTFNNLNTNKESCPVLVYSILYLLTDHVQHKIIPTLMF